MSEVRTGAPDGEIKAQATVTPPRYPIIQYFEYAHLPPELRRYSEPFAKLALELQHELPQGPEVAAGLRKLLEAKDCFVRAALTPTEEDDGQEDPR